MKNRGFEERKMSPEKCTVRKEIEKALQIIYFSLWGTNWHYQKHSFVEGCLNIKSGYQK